MFERYAEQARRMIVRTRHEASQAGGTSIESEHLLLALLREDGDLIAAFLRTGDSVENIRREIKSRAPDKRSLSRSRRFLEVISQTTLDLPLSEQCKHILEQARDETVALEHHSIESVHLLIAMLLEEKSLAAEILRNHGFNASIVRQRSYQFIQRGTLSHIVRAVNHSIVYRTVSATASTSSCLSRFLRTIITSRFRKRRM